MATPLRSRSRSLSSCCSPPWAWSPPSSPLARDGIDLSIGGGSGESLPRVTGRAAVIVGSPSLRLDVRRLDDRPPLGDLSLMIGGERLRRLLLVRHDLVPELVEPLPHAGIGQ